MKKALITFLLLTGAAFTICSCNKNKQAKLTVYLTDDPANYDEVNIDIQEVLINVSNDGENWKSLPIKAGVYNLLDFRNGLDTVLGTIELPAGKVSQIRMVLGSNNTVKVGTNVYDLTTPSAQQSGLKFNVQVELTEGINYKLWIDFDAGRSIVKAGNSGKYILKPVIKTFTEATSGAIKGIILPEAAQAWVYAINGTDTVASGKPETITGFFLLRGIAPGTYKVAIDATNNYKDSTINNVIVTLGNVTNTGTSTLVQ
jgi:hypothetical protein